MWHSGSSNPGMSVSHMGPSCSSSDSVASWESSRRWPKCLHLCHPYGKPRWSYRLLVFAWFSPDHCVFWAVNKHIEISCSLFPPLSLILPSSFSFSSSSFFFFNQAKHFVVKCRQSFPPPPPLSLFYIASKATGQGRDQLPSFSQRRHFRENNTSISQKKEE